MSTSDGPRSVIFTFGSAGSGPKARGRMLAVNAPYTGWRTRSTATVC
ncbi:hypothetical protein ACFRCX_31515 [Streptomyces sp. NPDC056652]